jgi:hypothetical protein
MLARHTFMNKPFKSRVPRLQTRALPRKHFAQIRISFEPKAYSNPAREFLICLGWLRLFRTIAFQNYMPPAHRPVSRGN